MFIASAPAQYFTTLNTRNEEETKRNDFFSTFFKCASFFMSIQPGRNQESKLTSKKTGIKDDFKFSIQWDCNLPHFDPESNSPSIKQQALEDFYLHSWPLVSFMTIKFIVIKIYFQISLNDFIFIEFYSLFDIKEAEVLNLIMWSLLVWQNENSNFFGQSEKAVYMRQFCACFQPNF